MGTPTVSYNTGMALSMYKVKIANLHWISYTLFSLSFSFFLFPLSFRSEHSGISYINKSHLKILNPHMRDPCDIPIARFYQVEKWLEVLNPNSHLALVSMVGEGQTALDVSLGGAIPSFWCLRCINGHLQSSSRQYWFLFCADALISGDSTPPCTCTEHHLTIIHGRGPNIEP